MRVEPVAADLGLRYAFSRHGSASLIGLVAVCGLALSVAVLVVVISVINGFEREFQQRVFGLLPHLSLHGRQPFVASEQELSALRALPSVAGAAPFAQGMGLAAGPDKVQGALITGIDPRQYAEVSDLSRHLDSASSNTEGSASAMGGTSEAEATASVAWPSVSARGSALGGTSGAEAAALGDARGLERLQAGTYGAILGARLAAQLNLRVGDKVALVLPAATLTPAGLFPRQKRFQIVQLLRSQSEFDSRAVFVHLADAQRLFRLGERVHGYQLKLQDLFQAEEAGRQSLAQLGGGAHFVARSWMQTHGSLHRAIGAQKATMFVLLSFLVGVAAFNLVSMLVMAAEQRGPDIAILKTLGAGAGTLAQSFLVLGALVGGLGIAAGLAIGVLTAAALPGLFAWASQTFSLDLMNQYFIGYLPADIRLQDLAGISATAFALCLLSALYPARRAAALSPSRELAHE